MTVQTPPPPPTTETQWWPPGDSDYEQVQEQNQQ